MVTKQQSVSLDALAERYATLKNQTDILKRQMDLVKDELLLYMTPGQAVKTPEYSVTCNPGRSSFTFTCSEDEKKALQNHLIQQGVADIKVGDPYIQCRFVKQVAE